GEREREREGVRQRFGGEWGGRERERRKGVIFFPKIHPGFLHRNTTKKEESLQLSNFLINTHHTHTTTHTQPRTTIHTHTPPHTHTHTHTHTLQYCSISHTHTHTSVLQHLTHTSVLQHLTHTHRHTHTDTHTHTRTNTHTQKCIHSCFSGHLQPNLHPHIFAFVRSEEHTSALHS